MRLLPTSWTMLFLVVGACGSPSGDVDGGRPRDGGPLDAAHEGAADVGPGGDGGADTSGDAGGDLDAGEEPFDCTRRPLLGQGSLSDWRRRGRGFTSCVWQGGAPSPVADCRFYDQVWPSAWPSATVRRDLFVEGDEGRQFIAMEFDSGDIPFDHEGRLTQEVPQFTGANAAAKMWSISRCPGDFNKELLDAEMGPGCIRASGVTDSFRYGGPSAAIFESTRDCSLQPNTRYFLNIVFTQDEAGSPPEDIEPHPTCVSNRCGMPITPAAIYAP